MSAETLVPVGLLGGIARLIEEQHFHQLPLDIKMHWEDQVQEVLAQSDADYLVVCKPGICFESFEKIFRRSVGLLQKDEWQIRFRVYNSQMSDDFEFSANKHVLI